MTLTGSRRDPALAAAARAGESAQRLATSTQACFRIITGPAGPGRDPWPAAGAGVQVKGHSGTVAVIIPHRLPVLVRCCSTSSYSGYE